ncbi:RNase adapter RapZ [Sediminivirga luteola]|uniref:RNase adapter RapZ n=1 Tax=Sediminivirga luteola TaxID=1774748 RepID=UPI00241226B9|nr:RNase adapter RapZ [Sediminivirga luteola]
MSAEPRDQTRPAGQPRPAAAEPKHGDSQVEVLLVSGMSGAGRSTAAKVLEDLGWYVVDNLPPGMLRPMVELVGRADGAVPKLAVVVDVRGQKIMAQIKQSLASFWEQGIAFRVLFLDASDEVLVRRFESVRRPHPLQGDGRILDGILAEREQVQAIRSRADHIIDTSDLNVHQLSAAVKEIFGDEETAKLRLLLLSFGFKYGAPVDADHVVDVRFLPNPHWVPELRALTGKDHAVSDYVLGQPGAGTFLDRYVAMLEPVLEGYLREHRSYATIAIGCTGGKHRSVAMAEALAARLSGLQDVRVSVRHRDEGRE